MPVYQGSIRDLEKLNFTINEAKVYLTLINIGSSLAGKIAEDAGLDRSSTYNALKSLMEKGIVSTVYENKRTIYVPSDPKKIIDYFKEKEEIANRIIPILKENYSVKKEKKNILLFKGFKGLKTVFQDILDSCNEKDEIYVMGSEGQFNEMMPYYSPIFRKGKELKKIKTKMLIRDNIIKKDKGKYTEYKKIPADVSSPATINIYNGKVAIFVWEDTNPEAILIENERVSKTFKNYFNFIWKNAKPVK